jgi:hypothetical protein
MDTDVGFAAGYAVLLVIVAAGIHRLGVISARRRSFSDQESAIPWPHSGSIALHTMVAAVASAAGVLVTGAFAVLHHSLIDLAVLALPFALAVVTLVRMTEKTRRAVPR